MQHLIPNISIPSLWPLLFVLVLLKFMSLVSDSNKMHANSEFVFFILWYIWGVGCSMTAAVFSMLYTYILYFHNNLFFAIIVILFKKKKPPRNYIFHNSYKKFNSRKVSARKTNFPQLLHIWKSCYKWVKKLCVDIW